LAGHRSVEAKSTILEIELTDSSTYIAPHPLLIHLIDTKHKIEIPEKLYCNINGTSTKLVIDLRERIPPSSIAIDFVINS